MKTGDGKNEGGGNRNVAYELIAGSRESGSCTVRSYDAGGEPRGLYKGYYSRKECAWKLWRVRNYVWPREIPDRLALSADEVRAQSPRIPMRAHVPQARGKEPPKAKPWWTTPDPEGQIKLEYCGEKDRKE